MIILKAWEGTKYQCTMCNAIEWLLKAWEGTKYQCTMCIALTYSCTFLYKL